MYSEKNYSWLSIIGLSLGVLGLLVYFLPFSLTVFHPRPVYYPANRFALIPAGIGLIISIFAIRKTKYRQGSRTAKVGVILTAIITVVSVFMPPPHASFATRMVCGSHMAGLGKAITSYAQENDGNYPDPEKWCDQLLNSGNAKVRDFLCLPDYTIRFLMFSFSRPKPGKGKCHYAMNVNCKPDSARDTVLLFETTLGWNKHGGPELLTSDNHDGEGCNILFNDKHVKFVKRPKELNWGNISK
jgi:hypothetical protein